MLQSKGGLSWHTENIRTLKQQRDALWRVVSNNTGNPLLRRQAAVIIREYNIPERNPMALAQGIASYFQTEVKFFREYPEFFASPMRTIEWGIGDCDDKTIGVAAILRTFRIPVRLKIIRYTQGGTRKGHVYPQAWINNKWLTLETVRRWQPGEDAEDKLKARGIQVNVEYIGDTPTSFKGEGMEDYDYDSNLGVAIDDEPVAPTDYEDIDRYRETVENTPDTVIANIDDVEDDVKYRPMPASFRRLIPNAARIYIELNDGRRILFERK
jgi:hypothetical protein